MCRQCNSLLNANNCNIVCHMNTPHILSFFPCCIIGGGAYLSFFSPSIELYKYEIKEIWRKVIQNWNGRWVSEVDRVCPSRSQLCSQLRKDSMNCHYSIVCPGVCRSLFHSFPITLLNGGLIIVKCSSLLLMILLVLHLALTESNITTSALLCLFFFLVYLFLCPCTLNLPV